MNVLITRAKQRSEVFTNLTADDIDPGPTNPSGVVALKRYLKYAQTDELDIPELIGRSPDSPFEVEVADALRGCGYEIDHQIGIAGYFIDLGVKDPERPGRYLLGIECDGATYHSAQSARDRDRIRQNHLEDLGWRIHRIWSTDWFRFPDRELKKAAKTIEAAKAHTPFSIGKTPEVNNHDSKENKEESETKVEKIGDPISEPKPNSQTKKYQLAELSISTNGCALHAVPSRLIANWIQQVVEIESPVHFNEIAKRITSAVEVKKVGNRIREAIEFAAKLAARSESIQIQGEFLYSTAQEQITVRNRDELPNTSRKLELIAPEEIQEAIKLVVSESLGIEEKDLPQETCRLFGFKKVNENMRRGVESVMNEMLKREELTERAGSLVLN